MRVNPLLSMTLMAAMLSSVLAADAKGGSPQAAAQQQQEQAAAMQRAQQEQQRAQQEQQQRAQQEQQRAQQEQQQQRQQQMQQMQQRQQQERQQQEQAMRQQEEQARQMQMKAVQQQQEQARRMQEQQQQQGRNMQEQQQRAQQEQQRAQQEQARNMQEQQQRAQQEQQRAQQEQQRVQQEQARNVQEQQQRAQQEQARNVERGNFGHGEAPGGASFAGVNRPFKARPLSVSAVPIEKAVPQPVLAPNVHPGEQEHSKAVIQNLQRHMFAVPANQAPQNRETFINNSRNNYFNNYSTMVNNRRVFINRQNTNVSYFQPYNYPTWYQPEPNWVLANGFNLGNDIHCGLDWLQWGWHPYYGPPPEGFVCAQDYFPTPWIYIPAYGVWRQPGEFAYSPAGPPYDYTGPISVEVLEPRHVHTRDPYSGWVNDSVINVVYFYNAFYYPDQDRWGYMNRHGYFIWLNLDSDDGSGY